MSSPRYAKMLHQESEADPVLMLEPGARSQELHGVDEQILHEATG